jgi:ABC-type uncharacterized transport system involved in gliding motility auxiliary subunit
MKINARTHLQIRLQNLVFTLLFLTLIGLAAWLSTRYQRQFDWTANARNTLSEASVKVLDMLQGPVTVTAYAREDKALRDRIGDQVGRYSRHKADFQLNFVNPDTQPAQVRELGISTDGELRVEYQGRSEKVQEASETALTNALQRLARAREQTVVFLEGHGERSPKGQANHDLGQFGEELGRKGVNISMVNLAVTSAIPDNADLLVVAGPSVNLLPGEVGLVQAYLKKGGNFLWLAEPGELHGLAPLAQQLGLKFLQGLIVDASTQLLGINDPSFALVADYGPHPVTTGFETMTLFPAAAAIVEEGTTDYQREPLLSTLPRSWTETSPLQGKIQFDADKGEQEGPLHLAYALTRELKPDEPKKPEAAPPKAKTGKVAAEPTPPPEPKPESAGDGKPHEQRIVVMGDGDFLSNAYLGNGGNLNLGLNLINWLSQTDQFINIGAKTAPDRTLNLSPIASGTIALGFLFLLPIALIGTGATIWFKRRRR